MTSYYKFAELSLPGALAPLTAIKSPIGAYVVLESISAALAYDVEPYVADNQLVHLHIKGQLVTCLKYDQLTALLSQLPGACIRARVVLRTLIVQGMKQFINDETGIFTNPLTGEAIQLTRAAGLWTFSPEQVAKIIGISIDDVSEAIDTIPDRIGR